MNKTQRKRVEKWCEDLESGKFPQTQRTLHDVEGYCCLGVACQRAAKSASSGVVAKSVEYNSVVKYNGNMGLAPMALYEWLGLEEFVDGSHDNGFDLRLTVSGNVRLASELNDGDDDGGLTGKGVRPRSFKQIASYIRNNFLKGESK